MNHQDKQPTNQSKNRTPLANHTYSSCYMKIINHIFRPVVLTALILTSLANSTVAQDVQVPDPGLNAAIRDALGKSSGPLTVTDMLSLTNLNARNRNVSSIDGL